MNAVELERNGWIFFTFIVECCVVIEKNIDKKLANRISHQICYKGCLKGKFGRGVQICEGGAIIKSFSRYCSSRSSKSVSILDSFEYRGSSTESRLSPYF